MVEQYQTTSHVPEALHRLTESYLALGMTEEAQPRAAVLGYNYPGSEWYPTPTSCVEKQPLDRPPQTEGRSCRRAVAGCSKRDRSPARRA